MRITVIGGTGVFGSRLARMLVADGHEVTIAARDGAAAARLADGIGARALRLDRRGDLEALRGAEAVVDAAGPFHAYGGDPYRLPRFCIAAGLHYLDLADDAGFVAGIGALESEARAAGVVVLSGVSSVPALSSSVVAALAQGMVRVDAIDSAILPGNRAPRGRSVMDSILGQLGQPFEVTEDGAIRAVRGWSEPEMFDLGAGMRRRAWAIRVPDQVLFPTFFGARSVSFRAGLEIGVMNRALAWMSVVLGQIGGRWPRVLTPSVRLLAQAMQGLGSDRGGMVVRVTGRDGGGHLRREWRLRVGAGDGPSIPGVAARALLRALPGGIAPGARPALAEVPLAAIEAAMAGLSVAVERVEVRPVPLFAQAMGPGFADLPPALRALRDQVAPVLWTGTGEVTRGRGPFGRIVAALFGFPPAGPAPVRVRLVPDAAGRLLWERDFGGRLFRSRAGLRNGRLTEAFGPFSFDLDLRLRAGRLEFPVTGGRFLGLPLPRVLLPVSEAAEWEEAGAIAFDVDLRLPLGLGRILRYRGRLTRAAPQALTTI